MRETNCKYSPVSHVIFDLDGLLIDSEIRFAKAIAVVLKRFGVKEYTRELQEKVLGMEPARGLQVIIDATKIPITVEQFMILEREVYAEEMKTLNLMPGAERLVQHLYDNDIPMAIATGSTIESFAIKTARFPEFFRVGNYFSHIVLTRDDVEVKKPKPHPDAFLVAAKRFLPSVDPCDCLVLEDSSIGVEAAVTAGMQCVMVPDSRFKCVDQNATQIIPSILDFRPQQFGLPPYDNDFLYDHEY